MDLFTCLGCAPDYDGNPFNVLEVRMVPGELEYNPAEMPALIGLYGANYTILFYPGEWNRRVVAVP